MTPIHAAPPALPRVATAAVVAAWLWLAWPALLWIGSALGSPDRRVHLAVIAALVALGLRRARTPAAPAIAAPAIAAPRAQAPPPLAPLALLVLGAGAFGLCLGPAHGAPHVVVALLACLGACALASLLFPALTRGPFWLYALLSLCLIPSQFHLDALFGFRLRLLTADLIARQFPLFGVPVQSAASLLVLETGAVHIDLPCSGLRSLWTGLLFFLLLSALRRARPGARWLGTLLLFVLVLLAANLLRVSAIVVLSEVLQRPTLAALVHEPLGAIGFLGACALALALLRPAPAAATPVPATLPPRGALALAGALALLAALRPPVPPPAPAALDLTLPSDLGATPLDPSPAELDLLGRHEGALRKWRFTMDRSGRAGSLVIAISTSALGQHAPAQCLAAAGLTLRRSEIHQLANDPQKPIALLHLQGHDGVPRRAATWYQSATETTSDPLRRALALRGRVALVTALFDEPRSASLRATDQDSDDAADDALLARVHQTVAAHLMGDR